MTHDRHGNEVQIGDRVRMVPIGLYVPRWADGHHGDVTHITKHGKMRVRVGDLKDLKNVTPDEIEKL